MFTIIDVLKELLETMVMSVPPWNVRNKLINLGDIVHIFSKFDVKRPPKMLDIYQKALTHKSYAIQKKNVRHLTVDAKVADVADPVSVEFPDEIKELYKNCVPLQSFSYERLELLGDAVLGMVVADYLYHRYPDQDEGFLTRTRSDIVCKEMLAKLNKSIGLSAFTLLSQHVETTIGRCSSNILEDTVEAFIGAIYEDLGIQAAKLFIVNLIEKEIDFTDIILHDTNYKDILLRFYQQREWAHPKYTIAKTEGPSHHRIFTMVVCDPRGNQVSYGTAHSKKKAEQDASKHALIHFGIIKKTFDHLM